ncbi:MAG: hypothetical protein BM556_07110 [Bacteriovorax sp. MedPE-SWde]|mgnify:CR=1 FL=1|nr:MAG: hypothetical protein BM556_07110 [Bacteriovorax sp. MedPE-SWde]
MKRILFIFCIALNFVIAQSAVAEEKSFVDDSIRDVAIIAGTGAGGAVLGLSTLSFVEEPGDHLKNIVVGGAIGIIVGVGIVAWGQANKSKGLYESGSINPEDFSTGDRQQWHVAQSKEAVKNLKVSHPSFSYSFKF